MDIGQGLASFGQSILQAGNEYHKQHVAYDEQFQLAQALSRLGINQQGQITPIDPENKDKSIQPIIDPKALQMFTANNAQQRAKVQGSLEAINRIAAHGIAQVIGPMGQERLKAAQLENQRYPTEVASGVELPLSAGQKANVVLTQEGRKGAPAGKQFWEGDAESPPGYYTPNQIANIKNRSSSQAARSSYQQLKTDIGLAKDKTANLAKQVSEFAQSYGFPPTLFESHTKVYEEGTTIGKKTIPKGYYGVEVTNPKTGDINVLNVGKEEWNQGKQIYEKLQAQRSNIEGLGTKVQSETAKAKAMLDWATRNPGAPGAVQAKAKAQAILNELGDVVSGSAQPAPSPVPDEE